MENRIKVHILGAAAVLVSGVKLEDWKLVEKYAPEALKIVDEDDGEALFKVACGPGGGSVNQCGICWGSYTSGEGYATVTVLLDEDVEDKKEAVTDVMGSAILDLAEIEETIPGLLAEIEEKRRKIAAFITAE